MKITADVRLYTGSKTEDVTIEITQEDIKELAERMVENKYSCDSVDCRNLDFSVTLD